MVWGIIAEQGMQLLKNERFSGGALLMCVLLGWAGFVWATEEFARKTEVEALKIEMSHGFEAIALNDASAEIRDIKLSLQVARATGASDQELLRIQDELDHAIAYKSCLRERGPNCEHLREVE